MTTPEACTALPVTNLIGICVIVVAFAAVAAWIFYLIHKGDA